MLDREKKKLANGTLSRRKALLETTIGLQLQQFEVLIAQEQDQSKKDDLAWVLERRKRKVRLHIRTLMVAADAFESSCLPVAGGTLVGWKLFIEAVGAAADSPLYLAGGVMSALVWLVMKLRVVALKSKAEALKTGIGD